MITRINLSEYSETREFPDIPVINDMLQQAMFESLEKTLQEVLKQIFKRDPTPEDWFRFTLATYPLDMVTVVFFDGVEIGTLVTETKTESQDYTYKIITTFKPKSCYA